MSLIIPSSDRQIYVVPDVEGVELYYRHPSNPEVHALVKKYTTNGERDPEIFDVGRQDQEKVIIFAFEAAALFLVGWNGVNTMDGKEEVPVKFLPERIAMLPDPVMADLAADVIFKYVSGVLLTGSGIPSEQEEEPLPN